MIEVNNLSFCYASSKKKCLEDISFYVPKGSFLFVSGLSGSGKSTLLRCLKKQIRPSGELYGEFMYQHKPIDRLLAHQVGFLFQNPDHQSVSDKVWHEIAFGLENINMPVDKMKQRVGEIVNYFRLQDIYNQSMDTLSSGQKQIVNLASLMALNPEILLLDEPTSRLDPFATQQFLALLKTIQEDFNTTIILVEHCFEEVLSLCDQMLWLDKGKVMGFGKKEEVLKQLIASNHVMKKALPSFMQLTQEKLLMDKKSAREFIGQHHWHVLKDKQKVNGTVVLELKHLQIERNKKRVIKDLNMTLYDQDIFCILGSNGSGKTTLLDYLAFHQYKKLGIDYKGKIAKSSLLMGMVPTNPQVLFVHDSLEEELKGLASQEIIDDYLEKFCLMENKHCHPYDLSGGQQQLLALIKVLLIEPAVLLLDEPTNGLDAHMKETLGNILLSLKKTMMIVSHDIEFCAKFSTRCGMLFDGKIVSVAPTKEFFMNNLFYTTPLNKLFKMSQPGVIKLEDIESYE